MAQRRMFSFRIINSARFLQMPEGAQLLYFHLAMRADDDGVVEAYPILQMLGTQPDNFKILMAKKFVVELNEEQVTFVTDWLEHNVIRTDRKVDSIYKPLLLQVLPNAKVIEPSPRSDVENNARRLGGRSTDGLGKGRLGQGRIGENGSVGFPEFWEAYPNKVGKKKATEAWAKAVKSQEMVERVMVALALHKQSEQWTKDGGRFVPHPSTWLNQERWNDELKPAKTVAPSKYGAVESVKI